VRGLGHTALERQAVPVLARSWTLKPVRRQQVVDAPPGRKPHGRKPRVTRTERYALQVVDDLLRFVGDVPAAYSRTVLCSAGEGGREVTLVQQRAEKNRPRLVRGLASNPGTNGVRRAHVPSLSKEGGGRGLHGGPPPNHRSAPDRGTSYLMTFEIRCSLPGDLPGRGSRSGRKAVSVRLLSFVPKDNPGETELPVR